MFKRLAKAGIFKQVIVIVLLSAVHYFLPQAKLLPAADQGHTAPFGEWIFRLISDYPGLAQPLVVLLITTLAFALNALMIRHDISPRQSLLPAITVLILMFFVPDAYNLIIILVCLILLLFSLHNVMGMYGQQYPFGKVLNATFAISISSMILPPAILFIIFVWFGLFTLRINSWREWVISLMGIILPYFYLALLYFWNDNLQYAYSLYRDLLNNYTFTIQRPGPLEFVYLGLFLCLLIISWSKFLADTDEKVISIRKKMWIISHFLLAGVAALTVSGSAMMSILPLVYMPAAAMISYAVSNGRRLWVHDVLLVMYSVVAIVIRMNL